MNKKQKTSSSPCSQKVPVDVLLLRFPPDDALCVNTMPLPLSKSLLARSCSYTCSQRTTWTQAKKLLTRQQADSPLSSILSSSRLSSTVATRLVSFALSLSALIANRTNSDLTNRPLVGRRLGLLESQGYSQPPQDASWDRALPRAGRPHCTEHS